MLKQRLLRQAYSRKKMSAALFSHEKNLIMFQDNPLLAQLKQQLHSQTPRVEGVVKGTEKKVLASLKSTRKKSYFIPPPQMKKSDAWRSYYRRGPYRKRT